MPWSIRVVDVGVTLVGLETCWVSLKDCRISMYRAERRLGVWNKLMFISLIIKSTNSGI